MNRVEGSVWGRWDLHFHTPSSYDYKDKSISDDELVRNLVNNQIVAVAITDHHLMDVTRIANLSRLGAGRLTVFPGIELRSELGGKESVHLIGIFSEKADLNYVWTKLQGLLGITAKEIQDKGDDNIYVQFENAATEIHELGGYVSVHVGRKSNSIENISNEHPYKMAFKEDLARKHIDLFEQFPEPLEIVPMKGQMRGDEIDLRMLGKQMVALRHQRLKRRIFGRRPRALRKFF